MKKVTKTSTSSGVSLSMILFIIFLTLKLTNNIDWSWWWVTCPLWIGFAIYLSVVTGAILFALIFSLKLRK